jgi:hypothetical protein
MYIGPTENAKHDSDLIFATKNFRKLNQKTPNLIYDLNFWYISDPNLAEKLGVNTAGEIYLLQKTENVTPINHRGYFIKS